MARKYSMGAIALLILIALFLAAGEWLVNDRSEKVCGFCNRPIQAHLGVIAEVGGQRRHVCCARCALSESRQQRKPLRLLSVTDYASGKSIAPEQAWYVDNSRAFACNHDMSMMDETKHAQTLAFDRCSPGTFAFAQRKDADAFVATNGGVVRRLSEVLGEVQPK
jgi:nitrous oxide reductase accessory protein NosL